MLEASESNPADRLEYDRRLDEMVDAIHKLDLAGMGASAAVEEGKFEKAPLEDILQMTFPVDPEDQGSRQRTGHGDGFPTAALGERYGSRLHQLLFEARPRDDRRRNPALGQVPADDSEDPR